MQNGQMQNRQKNTKSMILQTIILLDKYDGGSKDSKDNKNSRDSTEKSVANKNSQEVRVETGREAGGISPHRIQKETGISSSMIHRALKYLCKEGVIKKNGTPPRVTYEISTVNYEHSKK